MKFVLGLVALVFIGLAVYVYTDKGHTQSNKSEVHKTVNTDRLSENEALVKTEVAKSIISTKEHVTLKDKSDVNLNLNGVEQLKLDAETLRKIEVEVNGGVRPTLDTKTLAKIEAEVNGVAKLKLDEETLRKIEVEVNGGARPTLDTKILAKIEAEVNGEVKPTLDTETLRKIEAEVANTIL